ncbi:hypothetical protein KCU62_g67, partial [Aureobasidium sp. EXF-3399]
LISSAKPSFVMTHFFVLACFIKAAVLHLFVLFSGVLFFGDCAFTPTLPASYFLGKPFSLFVVGATPGSSTSSSSETSVCLLLSSSRDLTVETWDTPESSLLCDLLVNLFALLLRQVVLVAGMKHQQATNVFARNALESVIEVSNKKGKIRVINPFTDVLRKTHRIRDGLEFGAAHDLSIVPVSALNGTLWFLQERFERHVFRGIDKQEHAYKLLLCNKFITFRKMRLHLGFPFLRHRRIRVWPKGLGSRIDIHNLLEPEEVKSNIWFSFSRNVLLGLPRLRDRPVSFCVPLSHHLATRCCPRPRDQSRPCTPQHSKCQPVRKSQSHDSIHQERLQHWGGACELDSVRARDLAKTWREQRTLILISLGLVYSDLLAYTA